MWISREHYQVLQKEIAAAQADRDKEHLKVIYLEKALSQANANVDWLRVMYNNLSHDRAAFAALKVPELQLPTPQIEGRVRSGREIAEAVDKLPNTHATPADVAALASIEDLDEAAAAYAGMAGGFGDIGDEAAKQMGIGHAEDGTVDYSK